MPEGDRWQQYLREWRRLSPERRRAAILELSAADREAFRGVLSSRRSRQTPPPAGEAGATAAAPSHLPLLLGLLACAVLALLFVRGRHGGPESAATLPGAGSAGAAGSGTASAADAAGRLATGPSRAAPGVTELVSLMRMVAVKNWRTFDGPQSPIRWASARPEAGKGLLYRAGDVHVTLNGGLINRGQTPWDVVLWGPTADHVSRVTIAARESSTDLAGFRLWSYLQGQGWPIVKRIRCPRDAHPATWLYYTFGRPLWIVDVSSCDADGCQVKIWMYLDDDADVQCESAADGSSSSQ
ncbi:MAG TPA: hypothetical protein VHG32_08650 [Thermoanaerobaculia bacterium]|nr:hypothetical protein [Thermoanaerobaculia bacterium]